MSFEYLQGIAQGGPFEIADAIRALAALVTAPAELTVEDILEEEVPSAPEEKPRKGKAAVNG